MSQSVGRAVTILLACADDPQRLGDLADKLEIHRSTVLRILQTLEEHNFARRRDDGLWALGLGFTGAALSALDAMETRTIAQPWLRRIASDLGHTIHLAEMSGV